MHYSICVCGGGKKVVSAFVATKDAMDDVALTTNNLILEAIKIGWIPDKLTKSWEQWLLWTTTLNHAHSYLQKNVIKIINDKQTQKSSPCVRPQTYNVQVCVFNAHFYTSPYKDWQKYYRTSMLLKSAYTNSKIYSSRNIFLCVTDRSQPTRYSASPIGPYRLGPRLLQATVLGFFSRLGRCWACISTYAPLRFL